MSDRAVRSASCRRLPRIAGLAAACLMAAGCAETQFVIHGAKEIAAVDDKAPPKGIYKVGTPYRIYNTWYQPAEDYNYVETGIASWYGPKFHRKRTANGEIFNMNDLTAAHRTLPMPSVVRVVNLQNGRSLMLKVNDRGPFARGRIIDVSRRAAQLLGFQMQGTAKVRVEIVPDESKRLKYVALHGSEPPDTGKAPATRVVSRQPVPPARAQAEAPTADGAPMPGERIVAQGTVAPAMLERAAVVARVQPAAVPASTDLFVQAGAFAEISNATRVRATLDPLGTAQVMETAVSGRRLYRVRVGPIDTVERADATLARVIGAGYPNARIVVE